METVAAEVVVLMVVKGSHGDSGSGCVGDVNGRGGIDCW